MIIEICLRIQIQIQIQIHRDKKEYSMLASESNRLSLDIQVTDKCRKQSH